jgi:signal peptidase II
MSKLTKSILIVFLILLVDQILKIWVKTHMLIGESSFEHWGWSAKWAQLRFIENRGMAFGMVFPWLPENVGKLMLSIFRMIAIGAIIWYLLKIIKLNAHFGFIISLSLILAGAIGNLLDSAFYGLIFNESGNIYIAGDQVARMFPEGGGYKPFLQGSVVDMLYFPMIEGTYPSWIPFKGGQSFTFFQPIFNIADSAVTVGVAIILVFQKKFFKSAEVKEVETKKVQEIV